MKRLAVISIALLVAAPALAQVPARGEMLFQESFSDNSNDWSTGAFGEIAPGEAQRDFEFIEGEYRVSSYEHGARAWCLQCGTFDNMVLEVVCRFKEGGEGAYYGTSFRNDPDDNTRYYLFRVMNDGTYNFVRREGSDWTYLIDTTPHDAITAGKGTNVLAVVANGLDFELYVNGEMVGMASDPDGFTKPGYIGVHASTGGAEQGSASFDIFRVFALP
jgi:hypothetical protein